MANRTKISLLVGRSYKQRTIHTHGWMLPLRIALQSSAKCICDIKTHRTTQSHSISMTVGSLKMDSPASMGAQRTSQGTRSHLLTPILRVSKSIFKNEVSINGFKVALGQCLGLSWVYLDDLRLSAMSDRSWGTLICRGPDCALPMVELSENYFHGRLWVRYL